MGEEETIWAVADTLRTRIERCGVPLVLYVDWKNLYKRPATAKEQLRGEEPLTQFGQQANVFLENEYLPEHNGRFALPLAKPEDYHRRAPRAAQLDRIFRLESLRTIYNDWVVRYENRFFQLQRQSRHYAPAGSQVLVCERAARGSHDRISGPGVGVVRDPGASETV